MQRIWPPAPPGTNTRAALCVGAMALVSAAIGNILIGMNGGEISLGRAAWTVGGLVLGWGVMRFHHCMPARGPG